MELPLYSRVHVQGNTISTISRMSFRPTLSFEQQNDNSLRCFPTSSGSHYGIHTRQHETTVK